MKKVYKTFDDLKHEPHNSWEWTIAQMFFDNGYGVSVVRAWVKWFMTWTYWVEDWLYELAVLEWTKRSWDLCYNTPITDDVIWYCTEEKITELMKQVQDLPFK